MFKMPRDLNENVDLMFLQLHTDAQLSPLMKDNTPDQSPLFRKSSLQTGRPKRKYIKQIHIPVKQKSKSTENKPQVEPTIKSNQAENSSTENRTNQHPDDK